MEVDSGWLENEDDGFDDNGCPSCDPPSAEEVPEESSEDQSVPLAPPKSLQGLSPKEVEDGEDDNGVDSNFKDGENATEPQSSAQEKQEDPEGTTQGSCEQNNISKPDDTIDDCKDSTLTVKVGEGPRQAPNDETITEECIEESEKTVDDEGSLAEKTSDKEISPIDSDKDEAQTYQTGEPTQVDCFDNGTRVLPTSTGIEGKSSSGRGNVATPPDGDMEPVDPGLSRDGNKRLFDLSHQDGNVRKTTKQRDNTSSESGHTDNDDNNHSAKSARLSTASTKLNFLAIVVCFYGFVFNIGVSALTVIPGDVLASSGSTARLRCSTDYKSPVYWDRKLFGSDAQETIYYGKNGMARIAGDRIRVEEDSSSGRYDLVISNVKMEDAGTYTCIDEAGIGDAYPAELVVFERFACEMPVPGNGFMGENIFEIPEDPVVSTCSLSFRGSVVPRFQWTWGKVTPRLAATIINGSTVTSSVTLRATHDMNGARLTCLPIVVSTDDAESLDDSPSRWISDVVVVRYVHVMYGSVDECQSNAMIPICNPNCTYKVQETPDNRCQCLAVYNDQERTYKKIFSEYSCEISESSSQAIIVVVAIVVSIAILAAVASVLIVVGLRIRLGNNRRQKPRDEERSGLEKPKQGSTDTIIDENESDSQTHLNPKV